MGRSGDKDIEIRHAIEKYDTAYKLCQFYVGLFDNNLSTPEYQTLILDKLRDFESDSTLAHYFW